MCVCAMVLQLSLLELEQDSVIVATSSFVFGEHISAQQQIGFVVIMLLAWISSMTCTAFELWNL